MTVPTVHETFSRHWMNLTSTTANDNTTSSDIIQPTRHTMSPTEIGLVTLAVVLLVAVVAGFTYLYKKHNRLFLRCNVCNKMKKRRRRSSTNVSHRPLQTDDNSSIGTPVPNHRNLFSITDEPDDGSNPAGNDDGYFYDEIFERSAFVDERTNKSLQNLCSVSTVEDDELPDLLFRDGKY